MDEIFIRKFEIRYRAAVRDIAWETAFIGEPGNVFFSGKEILVDFLTLYFTDYEPDSCFVAEAGGEVVGYLIGSLDSLRLAEIFKKKILARLLAKFVFSGGVFNLKNLGMIFRFFLSFLKGEFNTEEVRGAYPATLHINLKRNFRGKGAGARLILAFEQYLRANGVKAVHLATMSESAGEFFRKQGFDLLCQCRRSYFRHILNKDIQVQLFVKKLV